MLPQLILLALAMVVTLTAGIPMKDKEKGGGGWESESPGWGWGEEQKPAYDINPHFGFRQYSEMRYEPLTIPYLVSGELSGPPAPTQPLAPLFSGQGPPYSPNLPGPLKLGSLSGGYSGGLPFPIPGAGIGTSGIGGALGALGGLGFGGGGGNYLT